MRFTKSSYTMCSVAPFNRYASNVLCSTDFIRQAFEHSANSAVASSGVECSGILQGSMSTACFWPGGYGVPNASCSDSGLVVMDCQTLMQWDPAMSTESGLGGLKDALELVAGVVWWMCGVPKRRFLATPQW